MVTKKYILVYVLNEAKYNISEINVFINGG